MGKLHDRIKRRLTMTHKEITELEDVAIKRINNACDTIENDFISNDLVTKDYKTNISFAYALSDVPHHIAKSNFNYERVRRHAIDMGGNIYIEILPERIDGICHIILVFEISI